MSIGMEHGIAIAECESYGFLSAKQGLTYDGDDDDVGSNGSLITSHQWASICIHLKFIFARIAAISISMWREFFHLAQKNTEFTTFVNFILWKRQHHRMHSNCCALLFTPIPYHWIYLLKFNQDVEIGAMSINCFYSLLLFASFLSQESIVQDVDGDRRRDGIHR